MGLELGPTFPESRHSKTLTCQAWCAVSVGGESLASSCNWREEALAPTNWTLLWEERAVSRVQAGMSMAVRVPPEADAEGQDSWTQSL